MHKGPHLNSTIKKLQKIILCRQSCLSTFPSEEPAEGSKEFHLSDFPRRSNSLPHWAIDMRTRDRLKVRSIFSYRYSPFFLSISGPNRLTFTPGFHIKPFHQNRFQTNIANQQVDPHRPVILEKYIPAQTNYKNQQHKLLCKFLPNNN